MTHLTDVDRFVPLEPVLEFTGLTRAAFYSLRSRGQGPTAYRFGRRLMFAWPDVLEWAEQQREARPSNRPAPAA